jgi:hypothetical protein
MHSELLFLGKNHYLKKKIFYRWALYYFFIFLRFGNVSWTINMRPCGHWKNVHYIFLYTLILANPLHLTIESSLILIQNELWILKCCHEHSKVFPLCLGFWKDAMNILPYYMPIILVVHHFFGWKWFTHNVLLPISRKGFKFAIRILKSPHLVGRLALGNIGLKKFIFSP